jgi:phosphoribosylglycinamide formyltransferase-1
LQQLKIGVLISGLGTNLQSLIENVEKGMINGQISVVISNRENAYGLKRARQHGIDAVFIDKERYENFEQFNDAITDCLKAHGVDLVVLAGYMKILPPKFINTYRNRIINIHPSLIPSFCGNGYYGLKVHEAAVSYGVKVSGATVHFVNEEADAGPIILQESVKVDYDDSAKTLQQKVLQIEHRILPLAVKYFCEGRLQVEGNKVKIKE